LAGVLGAAALAAVLEDADLFWYHQPPTPAKTIPATATAVIMFLEAISHHKPEKRFRSLSTRLNRQHTLIGQRIGSLVSSVSRMALDPAPLDMVSTLGHHLI
jgi:hypothetical protein